MTDHDQDMQAEIDKLVEFFRGDDFNDFGSEGDFNGWSPAETAINAMLELRSLRAATPSENEVKAALESWFGDDWPRMGTLARSGVHDAMRAALAAAAKSRGGENDSAQVTIEHLETQVTQLTAALGKAIAGAKIVLADSRLCSIKHHHVVNFDARPPRWWADINNDIAAADQLVKEPGAKPD